MQNTRLHINTVSGPYNLSLPVRREFEDTASHISNLRMRMCMRCTDTSRLKPNLYHHYIVVVSHDLTSYASAEILPFDPVFKLKICTFLFHVYSTSFSYTTKVKIKCR